MSWGGYRTDTFGPRIGQLGSQPYAPTSGGYGYDTLTALRNGSIPGARVPFGMNGPGAFPVSGPVNLPPPPTAGLSTAERAAGGLRGLRAPSASGVIGAGQNLLRSGPLGGAIARAGEAGGIGAAAKGIGKGFGAGLGTALAVNFGSQKLNKWAGIGDYGLRTDPRGEAGQSFITGAEQGAGLGSFFGPGGMAVSGAGMGLGNLAAQPVQALLGRDPSDYSIGNVFDNTIGRVPGGGLVEGLLGLGGRKTYVDDQGNELAGQDYLGQAAYWQGKMKEAEDKGDNAAKLQAQDMAWQYQEAAAGRRPAPDAPGAKTAFGGSNVTPEARRTAMSPEGMTTLMVNYGIDADYQQQLLQTANQTRTLLQAQSDAGIPMAIPVMDPKTGQAAYETDADGKTKVDADGNPVPKTEMRVPSKEEIDVTVYQNFLDALPAVGQQQQADAEFIRKTAAQQAAIAQFMPQVNAPGDAARGVAGQYMNQAIGSLPGSMQDTARAYANTSLAGSQDYANALSNSLALIPMQMQQQSSAAYNQQMNSQLQQALIQNQLAAQYPELFNPRTTQSANPTATDPLDFGQ